MTTVPNFLDFAINAVLPPTFIQKLYSKLSSIVTFTFTQIFDQNFVFLTDWRQSCRVCLIQRQNSRYFRCPVLKTKVHKKSKSMWKLKHAHSILESLEYLCQITAKLILMIFSYTVSNLVHFYWDTVYLYDLWMWTKIPLVRLCSNNCNWHFYFALCWMLLCDVVKSWICK